MCALHTEFCLCKQDWNWAGLSTDRRGTKPCLCLCLLCTPVCLHLLLMYISKLSCWSFPSGLFLGCVGQKTLAGHKRLLTLLWIGIHVDWGMMYQEREARRSGILLHSGCARCFICCTWVWDGELRKAKTLNLVVENRVRSIPYWQVL